MLLLGMKIYANRKHTKDVLANAWDKILVTSADQPGIVDGENEMQTHKALKFL